MSTPDEHIALELSPDDLSRQALFYFKGRKYQYARAYYQRAVVAQEELSGPSHPDLIDYLSNLANLYAACRSTPEASALFDRATDILLSDGTPKQRDVLRTLDFVIERCKQQGQHQEAEHFCRKVLSARECILGQNHPRVARTLNRLSSILETARKTREAEETRRRASAILALGNMR